MTVLGDGPAPTETGQACPRGRGLGSSLASRKPCELSLLGSPRELGNLTSGVFHRKTMAPH